MQFLIAFLLASLALFTISLARSYIQVPVKELKRRARSGDQIAARLYNAAAYQHSLRAVLWFLVSITLSIFFIFTAQAMPTVLAILTCMALIIIGFVWLPAGQSTAASQKVARYISPILARVLYYLHSLIDWLWRIVRRFRHIHVHTGLYDRDDLLDLIEQQDAQADNRIEHMELVIAHNALSFGDRTIGEIMTPRRIVKMVSVDDDLGPVIMNELHASGFSRFPIFEGQDDKIVGILYLRDLVKKRSGGKIRTIMHPEVLYLHEDQSLRDGLQAILKTHSHLFIVVNAFEEYVGVISMEDILEQIIGRPIVDEFDQYDNLRAVAARSAFIEHKAHEEKEKAAAKETDAQVDDTIEIE